MALPESSIGQLDRVRILGSFYAHPGCAIPFLKEKRGEGKKVFELSRVQSTPIPIFSLVFSFSLAIPHCRSSESSIFFSVEQSFKKWINSNVDIELLSKRSEQKTFLLVSLFLWIRQPSDHTISFRRSHTGSMRPSIPTKAQKKLICKYYYCLFGCICKVEWLYHRRCNRLHKWALTYMNITSIRCAAFDIGVGGSDGWKTYENVERPRLWITFYPVLQHHH